MTKAILFDLWGTLVENGVSSPIKQVKDILGIRGYFSDYVIRMERVMMTRKYNDLREAFDAVANEFRIRYSPEQMDELVGMWNKAWMLAQPYEEVAEMLPELRKDHLLVLVSNTDSFSVKSVLDKFKLAEQFDHIFLSCEVGQLKTNPQFMPKVLERLQLTAEDCVMVGDSIQSDIMAARQAGMPAILMDRKNTRTFDPKVASLKELPIALMGAQVGIQ